MNFDKYKNTNKYPKESDYTEYKVVTLDKTYEDLNYEEYLECKESLTKNKIQFLVDKTVSKKYKEKLTEYYNKCNQLEELFIQDLKDDIGDFDNDCIFKCVYAKAYENGHSYGYAEIYNKYLDLYDFVEDVLKCYNNNKND